MLMSFMKWLCGKPKEVIPFEEQLHQTWVQSIEACVAERSRIDAEAIARETETDISLVEKTLKYPTLWTRFGSIYSNKTPQLVETLTFREEVVAAYCGSNLTFEEQQASSLRELLAATEWLIRNRLPTPHPSELIALPRKLLMGADYLGITARSISTYPLEIALGDIQRFARDASQFVFRKHMESYGDDLPRIIRAFVEVFGRHPNNIAQEIIVMIRDRFQRAKTKDEVMRIALPCFRLSYSDNPVSIDLELRDKRLGEIEWEEQQRKRDDGIARILAAAKATKT